MAGNLICHGQAPFAPSFVEGVTRELVFGTTLGRTKINGEDSVVISSDYGHADASSDSEALRKVETNGEIRPDVIDKIPGASSRTLYNM